jgi:hypothetical protein
VSLSQEIRAFEGSNPHVHANPLTKNQLSSAKVNGVRSIFLFLAKESWIQSAVKIPHASCPIAIERGSANEPRQRSFKLCFSKIKLREFEILASNIFKPASQFFVEQVQVGQHPLAHKVEDQVKVDAFAWLFLIQTARSIFSVV